MRAEDYLSQLQALLPPGAAWSRDGDATITQTLLGLAQEYARIDARAKDLQRGFNPADAVELLPEWEAEYGITPPEGASIADRQRAVAYRYSVEGDIKKPHFVMLAASMGYTIRIDDYTESMAGWQCAGDELLEDPWRYFSAGLGAAGDTLAYEDVLLPWIWEVVVTAVPASPPTPDLETMLQDLKPAHIQLNFTYL